MIPGVLLLSTAILDVPSATYDSGRLIKRESKVSDANCTAEKLKNSSLIAVREESLHGTFNLDTPQRDA